MGEIDRILELPRTQYAALEWTHALRLHPNAPRLFPDQEAFLTACAHAADTWFDDEQGGPGVLGIMSCGAGKTLSLQLAPIIFGVKAEDCLLLTEAGLLKQLRDDVEEWGRHYPVVNPPVMSYGKLSHPTAKYAFMERKPKLILCDEYQHLAGDGARVKRLFEYLNANPSCRLVGLSGTLVRKQLKQFHTAASLVLRCWHPLPFTDLLDNWSSVMDVGGEPSEYDIQCTRRLVAWAGLPDAPITKQTARVAWQRRLRTCPGVVVTAGPLNVDVSLRVRMLPPAESEALARLEQLWELPDGTMLVDTLEVARHRRTLRLGFFYRWRPETWDENYDLLRKSWGKVVRDHVEYAGYDSPFFVERAALAGRLRPGAQRAWDAWTSIRETVQPPESEAVWVAPEALDDAVERFLNEADDRAPIVWFRSRAVGDALEARGWPTHRAGDGPPTAGRAAVSLAYSKGWNGHMYRSALVLEPPTGADLVEQLLARHHRKRQTHDVDFWLLGTERDRFTIASNAQAVADLTRTPQRFLLADWPVTE